MSDVSVLTLVRGRRSHLANLIRGLAAQHVRPRELIIAYMQPKPHHDLPACPCPVVEVFVGGEPMPLAAARNEAARRACGASLVFLDVDCIPSPPLVQRYAEALEQVGGALMGEVYYLPALDDGGLRLPLDFAWLDDVGLPHPAKPAFPGRGVERVEDHGELWGLSFALSRATYLDCGGMDERFSGYGAEETDFAARLRQRGVPLHRVGDARCYHQHHAVHRPPLQHVEHIVRNARLFRTKWGRWCMEYWLEMLARDGFVRWDAERLELLRRPTSAEIDASRLDRSHRYG